MCKRLLVFPPGRLFAASSCSIRLVGFLETNRALAASRASVVFANPLFTCILISSLDGGPTGNGAILSTDGLRTIRSMRHETKDERRFDTRAMFAMPLMCPQHLQPYACLLWGSLIPNPSNSGFRRLRILTRLRPVLMENFPLLE